MSRTKLILFCLPLAATLGTATAATVTFDTLPGINTDPFTTITENGITVTSTTGDWQQAFLVGNPVPSIFTQSPTASLTITTGGQFGFLSFDLGTGGTTNPEYLFQGFIGALEVLNGTASPGGIDFVTITNFFPPMLIDRLVITTTLTSTSANIDNINLDLVSSVPEPGTVTLGALGLYFARRRRTA